MCVCVCMYIGKKTEYISNWQIECGSFLKAMQLPHSLMVTKVCTFQPCYGLLSLLVGLERKVSKKL